MSSNNHQSINEPNQAPAPDDVSLLTPPSNDISSADSEVKFKSEDISKKKHTHFFLHVKEDEDSAKAALRQAKADKRRRTWRRHWLKFSLAGVLTLAVLIGGGIYIKHVVDTKAQEAAEAEALEIATDTKAAAYNKAIEIRELMYSGSPTALDDVRGAYEDAISSSDDAIERYTLEISYVEYLTFYEKRYAEALEKLNAYAEQYEDKDQCEVIESYINIYIGLEDTENITKYEELRTQKCVTEGDNGEEEDL